MTGPRFLLLLTALTGANSNQVFRKHVFVNWYVSWTQARDYCRSYYVDMSIIDTLEEYNRFKAQTEPYTYINSYIGLTKNTNGSRYTQWCDGTALTFTAWDITKIYEDNRNCIYTQFNEWDDFFCEWGLTFYCYSEVILVEQMKTWTEALEYCRSNYTDLFIVTTTNDLLLAKSIGLNTTVSSFWIGLRFLDASWFWVNKQPLGNPISLPGCPQPPFLCGAQNVTANTWENGDCNEKMFFACYRQ